MPRPKGKWRNSPHPCAVCAHPQRGQIDYLLVTSDGRHGTGRRLLAEKFGITANSIYRHNKLHITPEYRTAIVAGPFGWLWRGVGEVRMRIPQVELDGACGLSGTAAHLGDTKCRLARRCRPSFCRGSFATSSDGIMG